jgi:hypothetical protein
MISIVRASGPTIRKGQMMRLRTLAIPTLALFADACTGQGGSNDQAAGNAVQPPATTNGAEPANATAGSDAAAAAGPLPAYVGRLPSDVVNGQTFLANPQVRAAVEAAVADAEVRRWVLREDVTSSPIGRRDGRIVATGCESHNCGPHHWSIVIDPEGTGAEVCYARNSTLERSTWYVAGRPAEDRPGDCPSSGG